MKVRGPGSTFYQPSTVCAYNAPAISGWPEVADTDWCGRWSEDGTAVHGLPPSEVEAQAVKNQRDAGLRSAAKPA